MKVDVKNFQTTKDIENAQQIWVELENTQNSLWKRLKKEIAAQIDVKPAIPVDNNIRTLSYDAENGKRLEVCFNTDMENSVIPKFHIGAYIYSSGQTTIEEIYTMIINISTLADNNFIPESAEKYADWIKKKLDENKIKLKPC